MQTWWLVGNRYSSVQPINDQQKLESGDRDLGSVKVKMNGAPRNSFTGAVFVVRW